MGKLRKDGLAGSITRLKQVLDRIEKDKDQTFLARPIKVLRRLGYKRAAELLLAQAGVAMLLRERVHVRRILHELRCRQKRCGQVGLYVDASVLPVAYYCERHRSPDDEALGITEELLALEEIEKAEDSRAGKS